MTTLAIRLTRTTLLALLLGAGFTALASAEQAPANPDLIPAKKCANLAPAVSTEPKLDPLEGVLTPLPTDRVCHYGIYDEFYKNGELCRYGDNCSRQYFGTCPNGWDQHTTEVIICC
ncbi:MAG TPA: hypothetical protein VF173_26225 [Thermoanaerobaculia bacterium]|nr:hypothetical protein [Thermoanaerobaculia bacterium]